MPSRQFNSSISKEEINSLPLVSFEGKITVVETLKQVNTAISILKKHTLIGFDTETRPSFKKGQTFSVSLLQLSISDEAFLFRLNKIGFPSAIIKILADPDILKIGLAIRDDIKILQKLAPFVPAGFVDLRSFAGEYQIEDTGLKKLAAIVLGKRISKSQQTSNWDNETLTPPQEKYAATDAWVCREIYRELKEL